MPICIASGADQMRRAAVQLRVALGLTGAQAPIRLQQPEIRGPAVTLQLAPQRFRPQGYALRVTRSGVEATAGDAAGLWYAVQTFAQLAHGKRTIPCVDIKDEPDFPVRGVMLDISRDKVPTMRTLYRLIDWFASLKINQLQLYTEHTFAYRKHRTVWKNASPMTPEEVRALDAYCRERFIELVPNQNCFGHMERWLKHRRYAPLAETTGPWRDPWGKMRNVRATLNPLDPRSIRLVESLLDELLPNFSSRMVNVGCDETWELGQGRSAAACRRRGVGRVYLDFVMKVHDAVRGRGRRMQFWADIIHQHLDLIAELPRDVIPLEWGYEADHPFDEHCAALRRAGLEFYVCPGTSSWCSFAGRIDNALSNLRSAAEAGRRHRAAGYLITDWGDGGHRQYLPASYIPFAYGAAVSWCAKSNAGIDVLEAARPAFDDPKGKITRIWFELGHFYKFLPPPIRNQSRLFRCMQADIDELLDANRAGDDPLGESQADVLMALIQRMSEYGRTLFASPRNSREADTVSLELTATMHAMIDACARMLAVLDHRRTGVEWPRWDRLAHWTRKTMKWHRDSWLRRNRPGGLVDSLGHYERNLREYERLAGGDRTTRRTTQTSERIW